MIRTPSHGRPQTLKEAGRRWNQDGVCLDVQHQGFGSRCTTTASTPTSIQFQCLHCSSCEFQWTCTCSKPPRPMPPDGDQLCQPPGMFGWSHSTCAPLFLQTGARASARSMRSRKTTGASNGGGDSKDLPRTPARLAKHLSNDMGWTMGVLYTKDPDVNIRHPLVCKLMGQQGLPHCGRWLRLPSLTSGTDVDSASSSFNVLKTTSGSSVLSAREDSIKLGVDPCGNSDERVEISERN